jgi:hypothetical protein
MANPEFMVKCVTQPAKQVFHLNTRGNWSHHLHVGTDAAKFATRALARAALNRSYKHPSDDHSVVEVWGVTPR